MDMRRTWKDSKALPDRYTYIQAKGAVGDMNCASCGMDTGTPYWTIRNVVYCESCGDDIMRRKERD
jgi:NAD-dependent SIR2 family protein deacetylase